VVVTFVTLMKMLMLTATSLHDGADYGMCRWLCHKTYLVAGARGLQQQVVARQVGSTYKGTVVIQMSNKQTCVDLYTIKQCGQESCDGIIVTRSGW
jgi:hypothetical protein